MTRDIGSVCICRRKSRHNLLIPNYIQYETLVRPVTGFDRPLESNAQPTLKATRQRMLQFYEVDRAYSNTNSVYYSGLTPRAPTMDAHSRAFPLSNFDEFYTMSSRRHVKSACESLSGQRSPNFETVFLYFQFRRKKHFLFLQCKIIKVKIQ